MYPIRNEDANLNVISHFKNKLDGINQKIILSNNIKESIQLINKYQNNICLITGSLYLVGELLNLN